MVQFIFQNAITAPCNGNYFNVGVFKELTVEIYGSATSRTVKFYEINSNGDLIPINGYNESVPGLATSTTGSGPELWSFDDISGMKQICMAVTAISGGNLTINGSAVM